MKHSIALLALLLGACGPTLQSTQVVYEESENVVVRTVTRTVVPSGIALHFQYRQPVAWYSEARVRVVCDGASTWVQPARSYELGLYVMVPTVYANPQCEVFVDPPSWAYSPSTYTVPYNYSYSYSYSPPPVVRSPIRYRLF